MLPAAGLIKFVFKFPTFNRISLIEFVTGDLQLRRIEGGQEKLDLDVKGWSSKCFYFQAAVNLRKRKNLNIRYWEIVCALLQISSVLDVSSQL